MSRYGSNGFNDPDLGTTPVSQPVAWHCCRAPLTCTPKMRSQKANVAAAVLGCRSCQLQKKSMLTGTQLRSGRWFSRARLKTLKKDDPASSNIGLKAVLWRPAFGIADSVAFPLKYKGAVSASRHTSIAALALGAKLLGRDNRAPMLLPGGILLPFLTRKLCILFGTARRNRRLEKA